mgnify:CR=1 FL=1
MYTMHILLDSANKGPLQPLLLVVEHNTTAYGRNRGRGSGSGDDTAEVLVVVMMQQ